MVVLTSGASTGAAEIVSTSSRYASLALACSGDRMREAALDILREARIGPVVATQDHRCLIDHNQLRVHVVGGGRIGGIDASIDQHVGLLC